MTKISVVGSGFAGLAAASVLARQGFQVTVFEKNDTAGGRARKFEADDFVFDMGPSWYWMPDVFEKYFNLFDKSVPDYYKLTRLDPSYRIFFGKHEYLDAPARLGDWYSLFDSIEPGSSKQLMRFLKEGAYKYDVGIKKLVYKPGLSFYELADIELLKGVFRLHVFQSMSAYIRKFFKDPRLIKLLEFPVLFLGAAPGKTPALYSLMNYADIALGTWYPMGGMYQIVEGMTELARELGVTFRFGTEVEKLEVEKNRITGLISNGTFFRSDYVVAGADYHHVEQHLLPSSSRRYTQAYWEKRVLAPSCLLFYIGVNKRINNLLHHTLFFDEDFAQHAREIYDNPQWPTAPQFYVNCPSKTDPASAPVGCENLMILIPVAPGLADTEAQRDRYFNTVMDRLENITGESIRTHITFIRSYAHRDFIKDYHAFRGNAYGLANTLMQTANLKPSITSKKVKNLFYAGQLTVPGPGVPPSLISGQVAASVLIKQHEKSLAKSYERIV